MSAPINSSIKDGYLFFRLNSEKGYTLIEILVTLTIIGLLFGVGYINFRDFSRRETIAGAGKLLQGDLRLAQQMALSGQKPQDVSCNSPNLLNGYDFSVVSPSEYTIKADCSGGVVSTLAKDVNLPSDITFSPIPSPNPVVFKVLGHGTNIPSGSTVSVTLIQSQTSNTFVVNVGSGGDIQ